MSTTTTRTTSTNPMQGAALAEIQAAKANLKAAQRVSRGLRAVGRAIEREADRFEGLTRASFLRAVAEAAAVLAAPPEEDLRA
jgi:hypothetical protein